MTRRWLRATLVGLGIGILVWFALRELVGGDEEMISHSLAVSDLSQLAATLGLG